MMTEVDAERERLEKATQDARASVKFASTLLSKAAKAKGHQLQV